MPNNQSPLTTERLLAAGFTQVGCWELNDARDLAHSIQLPDKSGVYAFAIDGIVQYVGLASKSIRQRLGFYRKPGASQRTNIRLNEVIRGHIGNGATVQILVAHPPDYDWNGLKMSGAEGLEAGLIADFDLPWNMRGTSPPLPSDFTGEVPITAAERFYVYDNRTIDKAIVHKGSCTFCNDGQGLHRTGPTRNSVWHGPYDSAAGALAKAKSCHRARTAGCSVCSPV